MKTKTLQDLRPNATIHCYCCNETKPAATAVKFYAHHVCRECATTMQAKDKP